MEDELFSGKDLYPVHGMYMTCCFKLINSRIHLYFIIADDNQESFGEGFEAAGGRVDFCHFKSLWILIHYLQTLQCIWRMR